MSLGLTLDSNRLGGVYGEATGRAGRRASSSDSDDDLLRGIARGESSSMEALVARYQAPLYRFLYRLLGSREDAEDAAVTVFVRAWQYAPRFEFRSAVGTWLYRIASNAARDAYSRRGAERRAAWPDEVQLERIAAGNAEDEALDELERDVQAQAVHRALRRLNEGDRLLVVLYYLEDRSYSEIQAIVGAPYTVLKVRLARARKRLRALFAEEYDTEDRALAA